MNYDLAIMALEGMARAPLTIRLEDKAVRIEGPAASFKELARLCLLIGGGVVDDAFELQPNVHVTGDSLALVIRAVSD